MQNYKVKSQNLILLGFVICILLISNASCQKRNITSNWVLRLDDEIYPANVPSTVIDDLILNNVLPTDFYYRDNFLMAYKYQTKDVIYSLNFIPTPQQLDSKFQQLIFQGLDTHCQVYLNGNKILESHNMHRRYELQVKFQQKNNITIKFTSPANYDEAQQKIFNDLNGFKLPQNYSFSRKAAYHYGWDWGPRILSAGIWKEVFINCYDNVKFNKLEVKQTTPITRNSKTINNQIIFNITNLSVLSNYSVQLTATKAGTKEVVFNDRILLTRRRDYAAIAYWNITQNVQKYIWWIWQLGAQPLFNLQVVVTNIKTLSVAISSISHIGFRTIKLLQPQSQVGHQFKFNLNGYDIYARGGNYIPPEMSLSQTTQQTYIQVVKNARDQNFNMIRLWGGGQFQKNYFYQQCDQQGILIWHDLMYACALYPYTSAIATDIQQQMRDNLHRLKQHPSIALWNGNNQVWIGWQEWGWKNNKTQAQKNFVQTMYKGIFQVSLPKVIKQITPQIPYWETSPSVSSNSVDTINEGDIHFWRVWGGGTSIEQYKAFVGRFNSEYGMQSMPDISTIERFTSVDDRKLGSEILRLHQRHPKGDEYLPSYVKNNTQNSQNLIRYSYFSQIMQSYALQLAITTLRGNKYYNMGSLYWQLNDVWPVSSWSTVDYYNIRKAAHYKIRQLYAPFVVQTYESQNQFIVVAVNDLNKQFNCHFVIKNISFDGSLIDVQEVDQVIPAFQRVQIKNFTKYISKSSFISTQSKCSSSTYISELFFPCSIKDREVIDPKLSFLYVHFTNSVTITAKNLATYVWIYKMDGDKHIAIKDIQDNYFSILPGQTVNVDLGADQLKTNEKLIVTSYELEALAEIQAQINHSNLHTSQQNYQ